MVLKICILEADTIQSELIPSFHGYGRMFNKLFANQPIDVVTKVYNVVEGYYPQDEEQWDAYLVTGSKADSFGEAPWVLALKDYLQVLFEKKKVLLGICFGHQILALSLGGKVGGLVSILIILYKNLIGCFLK